MERGKNKVSLDQLAAMDMVDYLDQLGFSPSKIRDQKYWYLSPLRSERTPSFAVNRKLNKWYDHGTGQGGGIISFALKFHQCSIDELFENFAPKSLPAARIKTTAEPNEKRKVIIVGASPISSPALIRYAASRAIPVEILRQYCQQVDYQIAEKKYFGIGFKNDLGGWELRNPIFKTSSSPKAVSLLKTSAPPAKELLVFEGFFDFLSYQVLHPQTVDQPVDFLVLNSTSFFTKALAQMSRYATIRLFLDHDLTGQNCSLEARKLNQQTGMKQFIDESSFYTGHKDLNAWLVYLHLKEHPDIPP